MFSHRMKTLTKRRAHRYRRRWFINGRIRPVPANRKMAVEGCGCGGGGGDPLRSRRSSITGFSRRLARGFSVFIGRGVDSTGPNWAKNTTRSNGVLRPNSMETNKHGGQEDWTALTPLWVPLRKFATIHQVVSRNREQMPIQRRNPTPFVTNGNSGSRHVTHSLKDCRGWT